MSADEVHRVPPKKGDIEVQSATPPGQERWFLGEAIYCLGTRCLQSKFLMPFQENLISAAAERRWESREGEWQWNMALSHLSHLIVKDGGEEKKNPTQSFRGEHGALGERNMLIITSASPSQCPVRGMAALGCG